MLPFLPMGMKDKCHALELSHAFVPPENANLSVKYFVTCKVYNDEGGLKKRHHS